MGWIDGARARARLLFARRAAESRMEEEIRFHVEMEAERLARAEGLSAAEARRRALVAFGGVEKHKEALRDGRGLAWLGGMSLDLRLGVRMLGKSPGLTLVGVLGMATAIAIGAVTFGIIYSFIGTSLPLPEGDRLVVVQNVDARRSGDGAGTHLHDLAVWRDALRAAEALGAYRTVNRNVISADARPDPMRIVEMTASGFRIARAAPLLGRQFRDDEERPGAPPVVVIGYDVWQNRFAGEPNVIGRTLRLGATPHTIVGVMPEGFAFPINNRVWTPLKLDPSAFERGEAPPVQVFGRLAPGATLADAQAQLTTIGRRLAADHPRSHQHLRPRVLPYASSFFDSPELTWALHLIQVLVSMILVVIGTNVATLVYARTASRAGEIAVRTALGASRGRVVGQLFMEALVLSAAAAAAGLAGASYALWHIRAYVRRAAGEQVPYWMDFGLSPGMVLYVAGLAVLGAVIVGVLPALGATRSRVHANLQRLGTGGSGMRLGRSWTVLIVGQVAVAVALLPLVLYATFVQRPGPGLARPVFPTKEFVTASLHLDWDGVRGVGPAADEGDLSERYERLRVELARRLKEEPGVAEVVFSSAVPGDEPAVRIEVEGAPREPAPQEQREAVRVAAGAGHRVGHARVDLDFFDAFDVPILAGRSFGSADVDAGATPAIVNESFARKVLADDAPLGRRVRRVSGDGDANAAGARAGPWLEIVGVVADFPAATDPGALTPRLYEPLSAGGAPSATRRTVLRRALRGQPTASGATVGPLTLAVRVKGAPPATLGGRLREIAVAVDPMLRLENVRALDESLSIERMADRVIYTAVVLVTLSVMLLSAAGIYALMSFTIAQRRREIGIRAALGAGPGRVLAGVLARAAGQIAIGIGAGTVLAGLLVQIMEGGLGDPRGALLLAAVAAFMATVGLLAALGPARRALRIHPTEALRAE